MPSTGQLIYLAETQGDEITATLPPAADASGRMSVVRHSTGRRRVFVQPSAGDVIDGARSPLALPEVNDSVTLLSNGERWIVLYYTR